MSHQRNWHIIVSASKELIISKQYRKMDHNLIASEILITD